jgi:diketogulonate reductase-like aldo/keto reductase
VSNFDTDDIEELVALPDGNRCAVNQVLYHLGERGIEWSLTKRCERHSIAIMAYSPVGEGDLLRHPQLRAIARSVGATPAQVALAWLLRDPHVVAIPKTSNEAHVVENRAATSLALSPQMLARIDEAFPPPSRATRLAVI